MQYQRQSSQRASFHHYASAAAGAASLSRRQSQTPWYRRSSYASSYRLASERDASVCGRSGPRVENTYQLEPSADQRFHVCYAQPIIAQVLQVRADEIIKLKELVIIVLLRQI